MGQAQPQRRGPNAERRAATRAELLRLGMERFPIKGYAATSIKDIVEGSGISPSTWYYYFGNKDDFLLEIINARRIPRQDWWLAARDPKLTTLPQIITAALAVFAQVDPGYRDWLQVFLDFWRTRKEEPRVRAELHGLYQQHVEEIATFVREIQQRGLAPAARDPYEAAAAIFALSDGADIHTVVYGAPRASTPELLALLITGPMA